jgi:hypothetical protein
MLKGLTGMSGEAAMPALDPVEIDKKIRELETVLMWVRAQQGALELSIKTLEFQRNMLNEIGIGKSPQANAPSNAEALAKMAQQLNPAAWAWNNLQAAAEGATPKPASAAGNKKRKP